MESRSRSDEDDGCGRHDRHDLDETARGRESLGRVVETNLPRLDAVDLGVPDGAEPLSNAVVFVVFRRRWGSPLFAPTADHTPGAMLTPGAPDAAGREQALQLLTELHDVQGRLDDLKRRLRELAEET